MTSMNKTTRNDGNERHSDDTARFSFALPVVASILALYLAFVGPARRQLANLVLEFTVPNSLEAASFSMPWRSDHLLIATDSSLRCLVKKESESRRSANTFNEICRVSLQGKTRLSRGRTIDGGCNWADGAALLTATNGIIGLTLNGTTCRVAWETTITETGRVRSMDYIRPHVGRLPSLVLLVGASSSEPVRDSLLFLDVQNGSIVQIVRDLIEAKEAGWGDSESILDPFPISAGERGFEIKDNNAFIVNADSGSHLVRWSALKKAWSVVRTAKMEPSSKIRIDIDGDALSEHLGVSHGPDGCIQVQSLGSSLFKDSFRYSNCSSELPDSSFTQPSKAHAIILARERSAGGASALPGNLTRTRVTSRGYNLVLLNPLSGQVTKLGPNGKTIWNARTEPVAPLESMTQRIYSIVNENGIMRAGYYGTESTSDVLIFGTQKLFILRGLDGALLLAYPLSQTVAKAPIFSDGGKYFSLVLTNGDVNLFSVQPLRDFAPPLMLIPVMILLCSFWACIMWSHIEEI